MEGAIATAGLNRTLRLARSWAKRPCRRCRRPFRLA